MSIAAGYWMIGKSTVAFALHGLPVYVHVVAAGRFLTSKHVYSFSITTTCHVPYRPFLSLYDF